MKTVTLGKTGITVPQNAFGALPVQRVPEKEAIALLRRAYEGGMRFFDTARAYSDSEHKLGLAFEGMRDKIIIATKTGATNPKEFWEHLNTSLEELKTDYIDIYQLHFAQKCHRPGEEDGLYESLLEAKEKGLVRHIGITAHKLGVAEDIVASGLYETLQYPFSYLGDERELALNDACKKAGMGLIAMKGLAGGLITNSKAAMAFMLQYDNVVPIWGIQKESELAEWLSYFEETPVMDDEIKAFIEGERAELSGNFCRGCGYCSPCPQGIMIFQCARISQMIRRAPEGPWVTPQMQAEMAKIDNCTGCRACTKKCPYGLDIPNLLKANYEDYKTFI